MKSIKTIFNPVVKKSLISILLLAGAAAFVKNMVGKNKNKVLSDSANSKMSQMSSIDIVKSLNSKEKIKYDNISDSETQKIFGVKQNNLEKEKTNNEENIKNEVIKQNEIKQESSCNQYDEALGRCHFSISYKNKADEIANFISQNTKPSLSDEKVLLIKKEPFVKIEKADYTKNDHTTFSDKKSNDQNYINEDVSGLGLLVMSGGKTEILSGRAVDIGGAERQIKAGTTVLAVLNEAKTITNSGEQYASLSIVGAPFQSQKFPDGITVLVKLKLNPTQDGIVGDIISCSSRRNSDRTIPCSGQLEDINGETALRGEVYNSTGWTIVTTAVSTFLAGLSLSKITTSASEFGTTVDQTMSNSIYQGISQAITSTGQALAASFARSGTQISIPGKVVCRVLFTKDSVW